MDCDRQNLEATVLKVLALVLKIPITLESTRKNTPQWDSLKHIEIIFTIEDELGIQFSEEELSALDSVEHIVAAALSHHAT